jgi:hypothetical protein
MIITERFFIIDNQWSIVHLPERPNGFGVLIVGDMNHYVDSKTSSWIQQPDRYHLIEQLRNYGYTIFYSNLFERNWGSGKAVFHLSRLYHYIMKREILNPKIHLLCEGMGALAGLKWAEKMENSIRSVSLINPCIDLQTHILNEKEKKLFYKRLQRELSVAYEVEQREVENIIHNFYKVSHFNTLAPLKIWHVTQGNIFSASKHSRKYEEHRLNLGVPIELSLQLPRNDLNKFHEIYTFFKKHEVTI